MSLPQYHDLKDNLKLLYIVGSLEKNKPSQFHLLFDYLCHMFLNYRQILL